jgi:hypothetical protein
MDSYTTDEKKKKYCSITGAVIFSYTLRPLVVTTIKRE